MLCLQELAADQQLSRAALKQSSVSCSTELQLSADKPPPSAAITPGCTVTASAEDASSQQAAP